MRRNRQLVVVTDPEFQEDNEVGPTGRDLPENREERIAELDRMRQGITVLGIPL